MGIQDFLRLTEAQRLRDEQIVERIRHMLVEPLLDELENVIPGYMSMDERNKYLALLRLNEEHAPIGEWMLVDFGHLPYSDSEGETYLTSECAFYSGGTHLFGCRDMGGVKSYHPWMVQSDIPGLPRTKDAWIVNNLMLNIESGDEAFLDTYREFPVCFKIAYVAEALRQNVLVSRTDACRFAAGFDNDVSLRRVVAYALESTEGQRFGWSVTVRDTMPTNNLALEIASWLRNIVKRHITEGSFPYIMTTEGDIPLYATDSLSKRKPRESTLLLLQFVDEYLPSTGRHVGRVGVGQRVTWEDAYHEFNIQYPDLYSSRKSFEDSYHNAKRSQERS